MLPHPLLLLASCLAPLLLPAGGLLLALPSPGGGVRGLMQYFLQTQRALLLQRVRVQSGRGLVEAKVSKHRKIADLQPEVPRFWTEDQYSRLLAVKRTWDPELVFSCRHCVGDGEEPGQVSASTRPSWRYQS